MFGAVELGEGFFKVESNTANDGITLKRILGDVIW